MNSHFAYAAFFVLCSKACLATASEHTSGDRRETLAAPASAAQAEAQRRRADLRAALQAQHAAGANQTARQLSSKDRAELRQQLREQRPTGQHP